MNLFFELLPFFSGAVVSLLMTTQLNATRRHALWLMLSTGLGICINQLSGEALQWALVDILFVAGSAYLFFSLRQFLANR